MLKIKHLYFLLLLVFALLIGAVLVGFRLGKLEPDIYYIKPAGSSHKSQTAVEM